MKNEYFDYKFRAAGQVDIGKKRQSNQDEISSELRFHTICYKAAKGSLPVTARMSIFLCKACQNMQVLGVGDRPVLIYDFFQRKIARTIVLCDRDNCPRI